MAFHLRKLLSSELYNCSQFISVRHGHHLRGKPPGVARSLQQRLEELNKKDPELSLRVDIGFPQKSVSRSEELAKRISHAKEQRKNPELEKLARSKQLKVNLDDVNAEWLQTSGPYQIRRIAEHYGVFEHLFGEAYFTPRTILNITYPVSDDEVLPVYYGNLLKPADTKNVPSVEFESEPNTLWTLILTNPDGHFTKQNAEYCHWFVGNIPDGDVSKGETIFEYLQPFPPRGTGFHRFIFILYKQDKKIDYSSLKKSGPCLNLEDRTFLTLEFYRERQDFMTPSGLAFFQADWDNSLIDFYHKTLNMREPSFEYDFPPPYIRPQEWFPLRKPFNIYMDKYRDPKKITEELFLKKLKKTNPFKGSEPPLPFPNAEPLDKRIPSWLKTEIRKQRLGWGRINDV
ncbi:39S ribosomal protein L38, mitochondrial [Chrysoperla carnea]|uniref:39S ribosomal protein L38, mitochondrial n=1 Tax=Chrysoperla carnea TaxID=189513 RepID=UPI001D08333A|nr:39S ribosomal protein L38, mitochondrial [Chrysoperla carnea]